MAGEEATHRGRWLCIGSLVLLPVLVKLPLLLGWLVADPAAGYAQLSTAQNTTLAGLVPTLDPNIAYTSHALGTYAARAALKGESLWWNPFEGLGAPLAGEMQSAALFPPTLLLLLRNGQVIEHLLFQIVAALATFALLRQLGAGRAGAWLAGMLFGFNGVFAWMANAVVNPVCFLPVMLLGVERLRSGQRHSGSLLLAGGLAGSIYAGFPEVAYLDGLLTAAWVLCRAWTAGAAGRWSFLGSVAASGVAGLLLAAPLLIAFADLLAGGHVGSHSDAASDAHLEPGFAVTVLAPYFLGNLKTQQFDFWGAVGGYAGLSLSALAIAGLLGRNDRPLRLTLAGWVVLTLAVTFGARPLMALFHLFPLTGRAALYRYLDAYWIMAMCVLAGMAVGDARADGRNLRVGTAAALCLLIGSAVAATVSGLRPGHSISTLGSASVQLGALLAIVTASRYVRPDRRTTVIAAAGAIEAVALFAAPIAATPYRAEMDLSGVAFLRAHLGFQRFVTFGPIAPNYGTFFGIAQVNHNDLPVPQDWVAYARRHLDPRVDPIVLRPLSPSRLLARLPAYGAIGTRFVVAPADRPLPSLVQVHADRVMRVYAVPSPEPYLSAPGCAVRPRSRTEVVTTCTRPSRLRRLELFMPGWTATVGGDAGTVGRVDEVFQAVAVPSGTSVVRFRFVPPGMTIGYLLAASGLVLLLVLARYRPGAAALTRGLNSPGGRAT